MGAKFFKFFMKKMMSQRWRLSMSHHPCWRQEEQIPSGTPKLVRPWNLTSLFLEDTDFIPCAWQQWLSKPRAEMLSSLWIGVQVVQMFLGKLLWRLGESLVTVLILQPCGFWGLWVSGVGRNPLSLSLSEPHSGILEDLSCWGVDSGYSPVFLREQLQN